MNENEVARIILDMAFKIHTKFGPSLKVFRLSSKKYFPYFMKILRSSHVLGSIY
jgi:hypothetical protein